MRVREIMSEPVETVSAWAPSTACSIRARPARTPAGPLDNRTNRVEGRDMR